jgi:hypothetical protein
MDFETNIIFLFQENYSFELNITYIFSLITSMDMIHLERLFIQFTLTQVYGDCKSGKTVEEVVMTC